MFRQDDAAHGVVAHRRGVVIAEDDVVPGRVTSSCSQGCERASGRSGASYDTGGEGSGDSSPFPAVFGEEASLGERFDRPPPPPAEQLG